MRFLRVSDAAIDGSSIRALVPAVWLQAMESAAGELDFNGLAAQLHEERRPILPSRDRWFRALDATPLASVRAVILGQNPYSDADLAEGLAFSVPSGNKVPRSLSRILAEARTVAPVADGTRSLLPWAKRGALLLNTALTVREFVAGGHLKAGWLDVTDAALLAVARRPGPIVFFAWGRYAQAALARVGIVEGGRHIVCTAYHPADRRNRFIGSNPFGTADARLLERGAEPIDWSIGQPGFGGL
jgi:uracil-DNA glycosylase